MNVAELPCGLRRISLQDIVPEPWRNGAGVTRHVAAGRQQRPVKGAVSEWDWRISVADISAEGSFSVYAGIDRVAALVQGDSLLLLADTSVIKFSQPGSVNAFAGETVLESKLTNGPARLLNVMARRGCADAQIFVHHDDEAIYIKSAKCCMLLIVRGEYHAALSCGEALTGIEFHMNAEEILLLQDTETSMVIEAQGPDCCLIQVDIQCS